MTAVLEKLVALCALAAVGQELTAGGRLQDGIRLICGLAAAGLILDAVLALPSVLFGG